MVTVDFNSRYRNLRDMKSVLKLENVTKHYGTVHALQGATLELYSGEITALVGDNGAGKSTLVKVISGVIQPTTGSMQVLGESVVFLNPQMARTAGVHTVFQDLALVDSLTTAENMFLGAELKHRFLNREIPILNRQKMKIETIKALGVLGITTLKDPSTRIESLSGGQRQSVAIARAVRDSAPIVILDEPTAALGVSQSEQVLGLMKRLKVSGTAVLVVSHNLREVFSVSDRVIVMRLGKIVANFQTKDVTEEDVVLAIVGSARDGN